MAPCLRVVARDEVALDAGDNQLKHLLDLRTDPPADSPPNAGDKARVGQVEIAPAFPLLVEILDRPSAGVLHEAGLPPAAALEAIHEMPAHFWFENIRKREN